MQNSAFQLGKDINNKKVMYRLHQPLWVKHDFSVLDLNIHKWTTIKYLNGDGTDLNEQINEIPNNRGGLYLFCIKCNIIPGITDYPVYIGRAMHTEHQSLRKRCKEYYLKYAREDERPLITKMIGFWGNDLFLSYYELEKNDEIEDYERMLINSLLLPFNTIIPDKEISQAVKAFDL